MIRSVDDAPSCGPKLPPSIATDAGELHPPVALRHAANPRPYFPPKRNAPFTRCGTTTTHCAFPARSLGMLLSVEKNARTATVACSSLLSGFTSCPEAIPAVIKTASNRFNRVSYFLSAFISVHRRPYLPFSLPTRQPSPMPTLSNLPQPTLK